jgi:hypothetical protein
MMSRVHHDNLVKVNAIAVAGLQRLSLMFLCIFVLLKPVYLLEYAKHAIVGFL